MTTETKEKLVETIVGAMPYPNQIRDWDFSEERAVRFTWRKSSRFRVDLNCSVEEVGNGVLIGSDIAILIEKLLKGALF